VQLTYLHNTVLLANLVQGCKVSTEIRKLFHCGGECRNMVGHLRRESSR